MLVFKATVCAVLLAAVCSMTLGAREASALRSYPRNELEVGIGWGYGRGTFENPSGKRISYHNNGAPQIHVDYGIGSHIRVGAAYAGWFVEIPDDTDQSFKYRRELQNLGVALTAYPGKREGFTNGIYLRIGGGMGWAGTTEIELVEGEEENRPMGPGKTSGVPASSVVGATTFGSTATPASAPGLPSIGSTSVVTSSSTVPGSPRLRPISRYTSEQVRTAKMNVQMVSNAEACLFHRSSMRSRR